MTQKKWTEVNPRLDRLIGKRVRCPYCKTSIMKFHTTCETCGITKEQIANASFSQAIEIKKRKREGKVLYTREKPDDLRFGRFMLVLVFLGIFGGHYFYTGRKIRGFIMLFSMLIGIICVFLIFTGTPALDYTDMHPWRKIFYETGYFFPTDFLIFIAFVWWIYDWFAVVVFGTFKYPIRISIEPAILEPCSKNTDSVGATSRRPKQKKQNHQQ